MNGRLLRLYLVLAISSSAGHAVCQCPNPVVNIGLPTPTLDPASVGGSYISGTLPPGTVGNVQVCVDGTAQGAVPVVANGTFYVTPLKSIAAGQKVIAQFVNSGGTVGPIVSIVAKDSCAGSASTGAGAPVQPTITVTAGNYSGAVAGATSGNIRVCVNDLPAALPAGVAAIGSDGSFKGSGLKVNVGDKLTAQAYSGAGPIVYGKVSKEVVIPAVSPAEGTYVVLIGGVEQSGYSSLGQNTSPFVNAFLQGPVEHGLG